LVQKRVAGRLNAITREDPAPVSIDYSNKRLATFNVIERPQGGVARRTGNVMRWRDQEMIERWVASLLTDKHFPEIDSQGHVDTCHHP
jgi:hypothetical protein